MIYSIDTQRILQEFNAPNFCELEEAISNVAPSMCDYYIDALLLESQVNHTLNKSNIQSSIFLSEYSIFLDYDDQTYIEVQKNEEDLQTQSFW